MPNPVARREYALALDQLRMLAQRDMLTWWKYADDRTAANEDRLGYSDTVELLHDPFIAVTQMYGEQAALAAADYLFLERSLDDELAGLAYPEVADPAGFEQARSSFFWALSVMRDADDPGARQLAKRRLGGVLNRLVLQPGRETVGGATSAAGTRFARVAEPGACAFCLMLAGRGAVYWERSHGVGRSWHDNCRCMAIECKTDADLPLLNKELAKEWDQFDSYASRVAGTDKAVEFDKNGWQTYLLRKKSNKL